MAPIPAPHSTGDKKRPFSASDKRSELVTRVKYCNSLPDLPFDPKFISYPFDSNRFVSYSTTSLERNHIYEVLTEPDLGVDVELVIPNAYNLAPNAPAPLLNIKDERLLEDDNMVQKDQKRSRHHAKNVSWMRRTEYISTEQTRFQPQSIDKVEAKVGYSIKKSFKEEQSFMDRDSQIRNIEKTFEDATLPIKNHFSKPGVVPLEVLPVFPDFRLWKYPCAQVIFDSDPAPVGRSVPAQIEEMSQAMIRGVMDETGEQFVAYFLPTDETLEKRNRDKVNEREYEDEDTYEYRMAREYNWNVKTKATVGYEENYFFVIRDEGVYYNELETRVRLNKRRTRGLNQQLNTKLCVKHTELTASDYKFQRKREKELEPYQEDDDDDDEDELDEDEDDKQPAKGPSKLDIEDKEENKAEDNERKGDPYESNKNTDTSKATSDANKSDLTVKKFSESTSSSQISTHSKQDDHSSSSSDSDTASEKSQRTSVNGNKIVKTENKDGSSSSSESEKESMDQKVESSRSGSEARSSPSDSDG